MNTKKATRMSNKSLDLLESITGKKMTLANLLWSVRECEETTQAEFAKLLNVSRQYLCDLEHGRRAISIKTAADFALRLGYSPLQFVRLAIQDEIDKSGLHLEIQIQEAA